MAFNRVKLLTYCVTAAMIFSAMGLPAQAAGAARSARTVKLAMQLPSAGFSYAMSSNKVSLKDVEDSLVREGKVSVRKAVKKSVGASVVTALSESDAQEESLILETTLTEKQTEEKAQAEAERAKELPMTEAGTQSDGKTASAQTVSGGTEQNAANGQNGGTEQNASAGQNGGTEQNGASDGAQTTGENGNGAADAAGNTTAGTSPESGKTSGGASTGTSSETGKMNGDSSANASSGAGKTGADSSVGASSGTDKTSGSTSSDSGKTSGSASSGNGKTGANASAGNSSGSGKTTENAGEESSLAVATVNDYVNVRSEASTDSEAVGKLYNNGVATVLGEEGDGWLKIESGDVTGYVKKDYVATGAEAKEKADAAATKIAKVNTETLRVRAAATLDSDVITLIPGGESFTIEAEENGWYKITTPDGEGYIMADFADVEEEYPEAESKQAEEARLAAEQAEKEKAEKKKAEEEKKKAEAEKKKADEAKKQAEEAQRKADEAAKAAEEAAAASSAASTESAVDQAAAEAKAQEEAAKKAAEEAAAAQKKAEEAAAAQKKAEEAAAAASSAAAASASQTSAKGQEVANFALQFVGNPYVWGGTSLTNGADCSGFVMAVYQNFGYSLPHNDAADRSVGTAVGSLAEAQPGDLICYSGHVGLYIGGGQIVHASNPANGIKVSNAAYRNIVAIRRVLQ